MSRERDHSTPSSRRLVGRADPREAGGGAGVPSPANGLGWVAPESPRRAAAQWHARVLVPGLPLQSCSVLLSEAAGHRHLVVDTGFPQHDSVLLDGLRRAGLDPNQIDGVINTHFHLDHCGCNFLFPRAWVYGSKLDFDWAVSIYESVCGGETRREIFRQFYPEARDEDFDRMDEARVLQLLKWMWDPAILGPLDRYRWWEQSELGIAGLRVLPTPGHTPGHLSLRVDSPQGPQLIVGDARAFIAEDGALGYDMPPHNQAQFQRSRQVIDRFQGTLIPGHDEPFQQHARAKVPLGQLS